MSSRAVLQDYAATRGRSAAKAKKLARRLALLVLPGLAILAATPAQSHAKSASIERSARFAPYAQAVGEAARRFAMPERWIWAVMRAESGGDPRAVSPKGAMGLMQIMPATWAELRARYGDPRAWTRSALFVTPSDRKPAANSPPAEPPSNSISATPIPRDTPGMTPSSTGLFAARADTKATP